MQKPTRRIRVTDTDTYSTHYDVMHGVFNKEYRNNRCPPRGAHRLDEGSIVWFPSIFAAREQIPAGNWGNVISSDGKEIREYWPGGRGRERVLRGSSNIRYVFAKYWTRGEGVTYRFKGIFKARGEDVDDGCMVYVRTADYFDI